MNANTRKIYLIRHGMLFPKGWPHTYAGTTDFPLLPEGREKAERLGLWMSNHLSPKKLYSSPLKRGRETSAGIAKRCGISAENIIARNDLHEIHLADWDGLTREEVQERFPKEYEERGHDLFNYVIPGAESFADCGRRFFKCLKGIISDEDKAGNDSDIYVVAHAGVIRSTLVLMGFYSENEFRGLDVDYCSITELECTPSNYGDYEFKKIRVSFDPAKIPDKDEIYALLDKYEVPANVRAHMEKTSELLLDTANKIDPDKKIYDRELLYAAAMLHDIVRTKPHHESAGADIIRREGYDLVADIAGAHGDMNFSRNGLTIIPEEYLLYYADKRVKEDKILTIDERFAGSRGKCTTPEALENFRKRYDKALAIEKWINESEVSV